MQSPFGSHPTMIVQARLNPAVADEFESWYREMHLPHVLGIPGIVNAYRVHTTNPLQGTHLMAYAFADESAVQTALSSDEAQEARRDWERWAEDIYELSVEIQAPLSPLPVLQHRN